MEGSSCLTCCMSSYFYCYEIGLGSGCFSLEGWLGGVCYSSLSWSWNLTGLFLTESIIWVSLSSFVIIIFPSEIFLWVGCFKAGFGYYSDCDFIELPMLYLSPSLISSILILLSFCISKVLSLCLDVYSSSSFCLSCWSSSLVAFVSSSLFFTWSIICLRVSSSFFTYSRSFFNSYSNWEMRSVASFGDSPYS